jgi:hypothetical protein
LSTELNGFRKESLLVSSSSNLLKSSIDLTLIYYSVKNNKLNSDIKILMFKD